MGDSACQSSSKANTSSTEFRRNKIYRWGIFVNYNSLLRKDISREIVEELENNMQSTVYLYRKYTTKVCICTAV